MFVREGKTPNESFGGNSKRPNASFSGEKQRYSVLFVDMGERPNATCGGEQKHCCGVENGCAKQSSH